MLSPIKAPETTPRQRGLIRNLIALMIDETDNTHAQVHRLSPEDLPGDMKFESIVLEQIYKCRQYSIAPRRDNIIKFLDVDGRIESPEAYIDTLLQERTDNAGGLREISAFVTEIMQEKRGQFALSKMVAIYQDPALGYEKKYADMARAFSFASPLMDYGDVYTEREALDLMLEENRELVKARKSGVAPGPHLPFEAAKAYFSRMKWREVSTLMGMTGYGKTNLLMIIARHVAWKMKLEPKVDVVIFILETPIEVIMRREMARFGLIPFSAMDDGLIDFDDEKWKPYSDRYYAVSEKKSKESGHVHFVYCPLATLSYVTEMMERFAAASRIAGRKTMFFFDYLQKMNWKATDGDQRIAFETIGETLGGTIRKLNSHLLLAVQENDKGEAFGSSVIKKISQLVFSIHRTEVKGGVKLNIPVKAKQKDGSEAVQKDAMGNIRYMERIGDQYSSDAQLFITKANDAPLGVIKLKWEGAINNIWQDPEQVKELIKQKRLPPPQVKEQ